MSRFTALVESEMMIDAIDMTEKTALAAPTSTCRVEGLETFLAERLLEQYLPLAAAWCEEMGARLLEEVEEELTTLAEDLQLKPLEKKRLLGPARTPRAAPKAAPAVPALPLPKAFTFGKEEELDCSTESTVAFTETDVDTTTAATTPAETPVPTPRVASDSTEPASDASEEGWTLPKAPKRAPKKAEPKEAEPKEAEQPKKQLLKWTEATLEVPEDRVAALKGLRKENLRAVEGRYGVRVKVPDSGAVRAVVVRGPNVPAIEKAMAELREVLRQAALEEKVAAESRTEEEAFEEVQTRRKEITLQLRHSDCGVLLGTGGKTVRDIQDESGARVMVLPKKDGALLRDVKVRGTTKEVNAAEELIKAALPKLKEIKIQEWQVGALIGYKGGTIAWIQKESGARLDVHEPDETEKRTVWIEGPTEAVVAKAKALVLQCVEDAQRPKKAAPASAAQSREAAAFFSKDAVEAKTGLKVGYAKTRPMDHLPRGQGDRKRA